MQGQHPAETWADLTAADTMGTPDLASLHAMLADSGFDLSRLLAAQPVVPVFDPEGPAHLTRYGRISRPPVLGVQPPGTPAGGATAMEGEPPAKRARFSDMPDATVPAVTEDPAESAAPAPVRRRRRKLAEEDMVQRRRERNKLSAMESRQKKKAAFEEQSELLKDKTDECDEALRRVAALEKYVRELQASLGSHGLTVPREPVPVRGMQPPLVVSAVLAATTTSNETVTEPARPAPTRTSFPSSATVLSSSARTPRAASAAVSTPVPAPSRPLVSHDAHRTAQLAPVRLHPQPYSAARSTALPNGSESDHAALQTLVAASYMDDQHGPTSPFVPIRDSPYAEAATPISFARDSPRSTAAFTPTASSVHGGIEAGLAETFADGFIGGDDYDSISLSALFNIDALDDAADDADADFVPPTSPTKLDYSSDDDSELEDGSKRKRRRAARPPSGDFTIERIAEQPEPEEPDDEEDDEEEEEEEDEDLFLPIKDVPVPSAHAAHLYRDAMDALGVTTQAELVVVVRKIVEAAESGSGAVSPEQVEALRRLVEIAETQGMGTS